MIRTIIYNVNVVAPSSIERQACVVINDDGIIEAVEAGMPSAELLQQAVETVDGHGNLLMPGVIDSHVHFREPGLTHKATISSESHAAVAGGVTSFIDMPNTKPQTLSMADVEAKAEIASRHSLANYAFYIGATNDNLDELLSADYARVAGIKLFMGSSTGNMLVDSDSALDELFKSAPALIAVHAEDEATIASARKSIIQQYGAKPPVALHSTLRSAEACFKASKRAVDMARKYNCRLHIAHLSTAAELSLLDGNTKLEDKLITAEVSPHHLLWATDDYTRLGARIKMNPAVKDVSDRQALRRAVKDGLIDIVATDHAPHLLSEKQGSLFEAVSGAPMVQFSLPVMLSLFSPAKAAEVMSENPARLFGIDRRGRIAKGSYADLVLVEKVENGYTVDDNDVISLCRWTPLAGQQLFHKISATWVNGNKVYDNGRFDEAHRGKPLRFIR